MVYIQRRVLGSMVGSDRRPVRVWWICSATCLGMARPVLGYVLWRGVGLFGLDATALVDSPARSGVQQRARLHLSGMVWECSMDDLGSSLRVMRVVRGVMGWQRRGRFGIVWGWSRNGLGMVWA